MTYKEDTMELYRIEGKGDGHVYGTWLAEDEEHALRLMAEDAGADPAEVIDEGAWIVTPMPYVAIVKTRSGRTYYRSLEEYSDSTALRLLEELGLELPPRERLLSAEVKRVEVLLRMCRDMADRAGARDHVLRTEPGILQDLRRTLPRLDRDSYARKRLEEILGEEI